MSDLLVAIDQGFSACYGPTPVEGLPFLRLKRSLQVLNAILKELGAVKIPSGLKVFGTVGRNVLRPGHPVDIGADNRTRTHGPAQLLLKYGSDTHCLADTWEYWTPSHLRGHHYRSRYVQVSDETCHLRLA